MQLKVVAASLNHNSFGLRKMVMLSDYGQGFSACGNDLNFRDEGHVFAIPDSWIRRAVARAVSDYISSHLHLELADVLTPDPPPALIAEHFPAKEASLV